MSARYDGPISAYRLKAPRFSYTPQVDLTRFVGFAKFIASGEIYRIHARQMCFAGRSLALRTVHILAAAIAIIGAVPDFLR